MNFKLNRTNLTNLTGYYNQLHFKCNELELFYNFPIIQPKNLKLEKCPHISNLKCSRAHELAPDKCITERKCELYEIRDELFREYGIHAPTLKELDKRLRKN